MFYTYIAECADGSLYTGWTHDLEKRMDAHNTGNGAKYTRNRGPIRLILAWSFPSNNEAMSWEYKIKKLPRAKKLQLRTGTLDCDNPNAVLVSKI